MEQINTFTGNLGLGDNVKRNLIFQVSSNTFSYSIFEIEEKKCLGLKQFKIKKEQDIETLLNNEELLKNNFEKVCLQYKSPKAVLIPASLFDTKNLKAYLKFHFNVDDVESVYFQELKAQEAYIIYTLPSGLENIFRKKYPDIHLTHHSHSFIQLAFEHAKDNNVTLHVHLSDSFFDVLVLKKNTVQLYNSFFCQKFTDVLFFIANILNLFSLEPDNLKFYASGEISSNSFETTELKNIVKNIRYEKFRQGINYNSPTIALEQHKFVTFLNLITCE